MSYYLFMVILSLALFSSCFQSFKSEKNSSNDRPIIGIFAQPSDFIQQYPADQFSFIPSSYVKYVESAGARAVPFPYDLPHDQMKKLFNSLNGLIFPGGNALWDGNDPYSKMNKITLAGQYLLKLAIEANENGDYFPVWGTCLGYELLAVSVSKNRSIFKRFNSKNHLLKLEFVSKESRIFENFEPRLKNHSENVETLYFNHDFGIAPKDFILDPILSKAFFISSIAHTANGTALVASIEGKKYPFYGIQFHPEKSPFEWRRDLNASHTMEAVEISQELGSFFVNEAKKSFHSFGSEKEADNYTIYNYSPVRVNSSFMECYFFPKAKN